MSSVDSKIKCEIECLGYIVQVHEHAQRQVFEFEYNVPLGRYKGRVVRLGVSMNEASYPEYPPHFVHICGLEDLQHHVHEVYTHRGLTWRVLSSPPQDFWDRLAPGDKNMCTYLQTHIPRLWRDL